MRSTDEVLTALPDLRGVPLAEMPAMRPGTLDAVVQRALPGPLTSQAHASVAGFSSALSDY
jgi:hypothetical protein